MWWTAIGTMVTPAIRVGKDIIGCLRSKYGHVRNLSENIAKLEQEERYLFSKETDVITMLDRKDQIMERTRECTTWLDEAHEMKGKLRELRNKYQNISRCFCGLCPFHSLLKLGKTVVTKTEEVIALKSRVEQITIMIERAPMSVVPIIRKHPEKIDNVPSLNEHVKTLLKLLNDDNLKRIGIWGLPGVGKTTVMENLNNKVRETQLFDNVFWVTLSKGESVRKIQLVLLEQLKLEVKGIHDRDSDQIADMISEALVNKRYLLLLDEVFLEINLKEVGIHDDHEHGAVVFAYRDRDFCRLIDDHIKIERLSNDDARNLFRKIVGDIIDGPSYKKIADRLLKKCGGMPQVIKLIADSLRNEDDPSVWRQLLSDMQSPGTEPVQEMQELYKAFKLIYDKLPVDEKPCLLYWAFFPPDYEVYQEYLIECWKAEQFIDEARKLGKARDKGHAIIREFEKKSMLERGDGEEIEEQPFEEEWEDVRRVSLIGQKLCNLPNKPACSNISTLLLQKNPSLTKIPESFFEYMCGLRVLDLYDTRIMSLPSSISRLINLRVLYLNNCGELMELPPQLEKLKSLEILDLRCTGILTLPEELAQLTGLKCLRVSFKQNFGCLNHINGKPKDLIPSNVIACLSSLQELSIDVDFKNQSWNQIVDRVAEEVASLKALTRLCFYFPKLSCFETFIENSKSWKRNSMGWEDNGFRSFRILVGNHKILNKALSFELIGHHCAKNLSVIGTKYLKEVEACTIEECNEIESIIDGTIATGVLFEFLQKLHLINLPNLVSICRGSIDSTSLTKLTTLTLKSCPKLNCLFPGDMIQLLCHLQDLQVEDCFEIKKIIEEGSIVQYESLPRLKNIELHNLPRLFSVCEYNSFEWPSLEIMKIKTCLELKDLPFSVENAPRLRVIECTKNWWNELNDSAKDRLRDLNSFT
uniref:NB-ARC domain-containing protein n=1 Tax=Quercus lobata TaxID=97700 RepID=A0A7N2RCL1_QUELO